MDGLPPNQIKRRAKHRNEAAKGGKDCRIENIPLRDFEATYVCTYSRIQRWR